jgi:hypothetical protein
MSEAKIDEFPCFFPAQQGIGGFRNAETLEARQATAPAETAAPGSEKHPDPPRCVQAEAIGGPSAGDAIGWARKTPAIEQWAFVRQF